MRELGTPDDGAELTVTPGTDFLVRLPENATTGYQWQVAERPEWLICRSDRSVPAAPGSRAGAGGTHEFVFEAPGAGGPAPPWVTSAPRYQGTGRVRAPARPAWCPAGQPGLRRAARAVVRPRPPRSG